MYSFEIKRYIIAEHKKVLFVFERILHTGDHLTSSGVLMTAPIPRKPKKYKEKPRKNKKLKEIHRKEYIYIYIYIYEGASQHLYGLWQGT